MTKQRNDKHSTEFGLWLRQQPEIDSSLGYIATNIDFLWRNYKTGYWMLIEEKRYNSIPKQWQQKLFKLIDWACKHHPKYKGFHILVFGKTSPDDGDIILDGKNIIKEQLLNFLQFKPL